ncbi:L,D-transpeptidase [Azospirillum thermophilum]|uniref:L,D-transpeptidase n=1 Tax=Azospirillum thermophilum TaxID=2202148 RepID=UPI001FECD6BE|nr:L,D-transpeptidase [Azospirillum thermophilum]
MVVACLLHPAAAPAQDLLPEEPPGRRIVISLSERRLYLMQDGAPTRSFPVAIGRPGVTIPLGDSTVMRKRRNPTWHPTASQRRAKPSLPLSVPPGPGNPLGKFALDLGWTAIAIHGTNEPGSVGRRVSSGCFRMLPADIETLFGTVEVGTPVRVVREAVGTEPPPPLPAAAKAAPKPAVPAVAPAAAPAAAAAPPPPRPVKAGAPPAGPPPAVSPAAAPAPAVLAPVVPDPRCAGAQAPLRRLICDTPDLAELDGRARGLQDRFLAGLPDGATAAYALAQEDRRFDERTAALCWVRKGTEGDPAVAAAARACLSNALRGRLQDVAQRIAELRAEAQSDARGAARVVSR